MRLVRVFCCFIVCASVSIPALSQIPNAGFETWSGGNPTGWVSSNISGLFTNVTQSTLAHSGLSAVRGEVAMFFTTPLAPVIQVGQGARGFAYNQRPVSVTGFYQFFPLSGDRFGINVALYHGGVNGTRVGIAAMAISSGASSYTQFNVPFLYDNNDMPDTCILQFQIVGPTGVDYHVGSYFLLDDLAFSGTSGVGEEQGLTPSAFQLLQNYPNPFNPTTMIEYQLPTQVHVWLTVCDALGREVATLVNGVEPAGYKSVRYDGTRLTSGVYFVRLRAGSYTSVKKLLLLK